MRSLVLFPLALVSLTAFRPQPAGADASTDFPAPCAAAHEAYASGDLKAIARGVVACLRVEGLSEPARKNIMGLLDASYRLGKGRIPGDFQVPSGVEKFTLTQRRVEMEGASYFQMELAGTGLVPEELQLQRADGTVLLRRGEGGAKWETPPNQFMLKRRMNSPEPAGLFAIVLKMPGKEAVTQWVPVSEWAPESGPVIREPRPGSVVTSSRPRISWTLAKPLGAGYLRPKVYVRVVENDAPDYAWNIVWGAEGDFSLPTEWVVGEGGSGAGQLRSGRHVLEVSQREIRQFGDVYVSRRATSRVTFHVR